MKLLDGMVSIKTPFAELDLCPTAGASAVFEMSAEPM